MLFPSIYRNLIQPQTTDQNTRRQEFILNILLASSIALAGIAAVKNQITFWRLVNLGIPYDGVPVYVMPLVFLGLIVLLLLSRLGLIRIVSFVLIGLLYAGAAATSYSWGVEVPQALIIFVLVIVMAGVLINTQFAIIISGLISGTLLLFSYLSTTNVTQPDLSWKAVPFRLDDTVTLVVTLTVITVVSWLSNREIEKSLQRAQASEASLKQERDHLEERVAERTQELEKARVEKLVDLYHQAEFGRLAVGLFHDLVTPLNTVALTLDQLSLRNDATSSEQAKEVHTALQRAIRGTKSMENFVTSVRQQINQKEASILFSPQQVINQVLWILSTRAEAEKVAVQCTYTDHDVRLHGSPVKFYQVVLNLVVNALDAYYKDTILTKRQVEVQLRREQGNILVSVQDWGKGIAPEHLQKVFEPFFTTKNKGTGIGLSISREIVEKEFNGTIHVHSKMGRETIFMVTLPVPVLS